MTSGKSSSRRRKRPRARKMTIEQLTVDSDTLHLCILSIPERSSVERKGGRHSIGVTGRIGHQFGLIEGSISSHGYHYCI